MAAQSVRELIRRWGRLRRLTDEQAEYAMYDWAGCFGVGQELRLERVHPSQVTGDRGRRGCSLVGVVWDARRACVYHTRALTGEDLVHELLHVVHPEWTEEQVVEETARVLRSPARRHTCGAANSRCQEVAAA